MPYLVKGALKLTYGDGVLSHTRIISVCTDVGAADEATAARSVQQHVRLVEQAQQANWEHVTCERQN
jgi:hypothetical protein